MKVVIKRLDGHDETGIRLIEPVSREGVAILYSDQRWKVAIRADIPSEIRNEDVLNFMVNGGYEAVEIPKNEFKYLCQTTRTFPLFDDSSEKIPTIKELATVKIRDYAKTLEKYLLQS